MLLRPTPEFDFETQKSKKGTKATSAERPLVKMATHTATSLEAPLQQLSNVLAGGSKSPVGMVSPTKNVTPEEHVTPSAGWPDETLSYICDRMQAVAKDEWSPQYIQVQLDALRNRDWSTHTEETPHLLLGMAIIDKRRALTHQGKTSASLLSKLLQEWAPIKHTA